MALRIVIGHLHFLRVPYTKLVEQNLPSVIDINLVECFLGLLDPHVHPQVAQATAELTEIDTAVVPGVDVIEYRPQLVEVHDVDQQFRELEAFYPRIAIAPSRLGCGVLVGTHQGGLVVAKLPKRLLHTHLIDLGQTDFIVAVEV